jgi:hypothetical protein
MQVIRAKGLKVPEKETLARIFVHLEAEDRRSAQHMNATFCDVHFQSIVCVDGINFLIS